MRRKHVVRNAHVSLRDTHHIHIRQYPYQARRSHGCACEALVRLHPVPYLYLVLQRVDQSNCGLHNRAEQETPICYCNWYGSSHRLQLIIGILAWTSRNGASDTVRNLPNLTSPARQVDFTSSNKFAVADLYKVDFSTAFVSRNIGCDLA